MIENCSREYKKKIIHISTQKYIDGGVMEKYVLDITIKIRNNKQLLTTTEVNVVVVTSVVNLCDLKAKIYVFKITSE